MEKQIEEMRKDLIEIFDEEYEKRRIITADFTAINLANKGYRKASDVAREILALIWDAYQTTHYDSEFEERFDKIAKKYESEENK